MRALCVILVCSNDIAIIIIRKRICQVKIFILKFTLLDKSILRKRVYFILKLKTTSDEGVEKIKVADLSEKKIIDSHYLLE